MASDRRFMGLCDSSDTLRIDVPCPSIWCIMCVLPDRCRTANCPVCDRDGSVVRGVSGLVVLGLCVACVEGLRRLFVLLR